MKLLYTCGVALFLLSFCAVADAEEQPQAVPAVKEWVRMVAPQEGSEVIGKKPVVKFEFMEPVDLNTLLVMVDGTDVTQLLDTTEKGFEYRPIAVLQAGPHNVSVSANGKGGNQRQRNVSFSTRHTAALTEAYSDNNASLLYEAIIVKPDSVTNIPRSKLEGNLRSDTKVREKEWQFTFNTNLRLLEQDAPVFFPQKKGIDAANWIFTGSYIKDDLKFRASLGDVQINETQYTLFNLARRGGIFTFEYGNYQIEAFGTKSQQFFGFRGGLGFGGDVEDHIYGVSAGVKLLDGKIGFKTVYATGGEPGSSFGIATIAGAKKGDVLGFLLTTDLFENKARTEFEADLSKFDPDSSDEFKAKSDSAYKLKVGGALGIYNYEAMYEHVGRDYAVVGNLMLPKDREGASLRNGLNIEGHSINLMLSRYNDNVREDELFPRIVNYQGGLDYSFNNIPNIPIGLGYQKGIQKSTREPAGSMPMELRTDMLTGRIGYMKESLNLGVQAAYSWMDDRTPANNDTRTITYTFTPAYNIPNLSINPNFSLNRTKSFLTDVTTDTYMVALDLRSKFYRERISFDVGGTCMSMRANNGSMNMRNFNTNFRLAYNLKKLLKGLIDPTVGIRGTYLKIIDKINPGASRDEFILFLVLATSTPFSF